MKYWFDTEFIELGPDNPIRLLSIGIVSEDNREFYAEARWTDRSLGSDWVQENVIAHLHTCEALLDPSEEHIVYVDPIATTCPLMTRSEMAAAIIKFCTPTTYGKPEFWAYFADYDWVVLCQIFGTMMDLPDGWPMYCNDLKQLSMSLGNIRLPEQGKDEHHALYDARWNRESHKVLLAYQSTKLW